MEGKGRKKNKIKQSGREIKKISSLFVLVLIYEAVLEAIAPMQGNTLRRFRGFLFFLYSWSAVNICNQFPIPP